jgi:hypothetical protein
VHGDRLKIPPLLLAIDRYAQLAEEYCRTHRKDEEGDSLLLLPAFFAEQDSDGVTDAARMHALLLKPTAIEAAVYDRGIVMLLIVDGAMLMVAWECGGEHGDGERGEGPR